ncbi:MAG: 4Fe-4S dicluster domain-containing protein [Bacillota bacterium]|nr:4Fe-4S dicluster domain-containing protein [Bacillota bacterium]MDW7683243.1 4Fe-4S dicluster domain-containing protein [Bacillota bacterium]
MNITEELKSYIIELGAADVGIAPAKRFDRVPEGHRPGDYLKGTESVVTFTYNLSRGAVKNLPSSRNEYMQEFEMANRTLSEIAHKTARFLEERSFDSLAFGPEASIGDYSRLKGDFSHKHSAFLCGLGHFGVNNLLITPKHRAQIRLASVATTAKLDYDNVAISRECEKCQKCVKACPSGALSSWKDTYSPETGWTIDKEKCAHYIFVVLGSKRCGMCVQACT